MMGYVQQGHTSTMTVEIMKKKAIFVIGMVHEPKGVPRHIALNARSKYELGTDSVP